MDEPTSEKPYFDSEEVAERVRRKIVGLAFLEFDHGRAQELPLRSDVLAYTRDRLFRGGSGLIWAAGGFPLPDVAKESDGTVKVVWAVDDRILSLWVPCHDTVVLERYEEDTDGYLAFTLHSETAHGEFRDEVVRGFAWLRGGE